VKRKHYGWVFACTVLGSSSVHAEGFDSSKYALGDWGGLRAGLAGQGVDFNFRYVAALAYSGEGGERRAGAYADQINVGGSFDLHKLMGWPGATFKVEVIDRNGDSINNKADMPFLLNAQEIYGRGPVTRLSQLSLTQKIGDAWTVKLGRLYASADFYAISCKFQNLTFCGALTGYITNGWYNSPISQYGAVLAFRPAHAWTLKLGAYDSNDRNLSRRQFLRLDTPGGWKHTLLVGEVEYAPVFGKKLDGDYRWGALRNGNRYARVVNVAGFPSDVMHGAVTDSTERAYYFNMDQQLFRHQGGEGLRMFASWLKADGRVDRRDQIIEAGAWLDGFFASRPDDRLGLAMGRTRINPRLTQAQVFYNSTYVPTGKPPLNVQRYEYITELDYSFAVTPALSIMPNVQYVRHPNGWNIGHALVLGTHVTLYL
jgi:porin